MSQRGIAKPSAGRYRKDKKAYFLPFLQQQKKQQHMAL
jgi:hypothetical protein